MDEKEQRQRLIDIQNTFQSPHGQRVLVDLQKVCGCHDYLFSAENPHLTAYRLGMRAVVLWIESMLAKDVDEIGRQSTADGALDGAKDGQD